MSSGNRATRRRQKAPRKDLVAAAEHRNAGRLDRAESICKKVLQRIPDDADALHLLAVVTLERGHPDRAIQLFTRVLARFPNLAAAHSNLGNAFQAARRLGEGVASYRRAISLQPDFASAHSNLGLVLAEQGELAAALVCCKRAVELEPSNCDLLNNLSNVYGASGELKAAEATLRRALELSPKRTDFHVNMGNLLIELKRPQEAVFSYEQAVAISPDQARTHHRLGLCRSLNDDIEGAIESYREAIALAPDDAALWNDLGRALRAMGRFAEAAAAFRRVLAINSNFTDAYRNLATCGRGGDVEIAQIAALADHTGLPLEDRAIAGFALGKLLDDADRFDEAFDAFAKANLITRSAPRTLGQRFDADMLRRQVDDTIARFTSQFFESIAGWGNRSELPVFVMGMPRSGTSLVEQIAASHSQVFGAGELVDISRIAAQLDHDPDRWGRTDIRRLADAHVARLKTLGLGASRVIDKFPDNVFMLGLIAVLFPSAHIVFCERDPRDIGLSCFFQKFSPGQLMFSYDLADCGVRYRETARLIAHWRQVVPLQMLDVSYEALVADLEGESRRLISFLHQAWEPRCLEFYRTERAVRTASSWQVRQPLYAKSVGRWRHYERHLRPLLAALQTVGPD